MEQTNAQAPALTTVVLGRNQLVLACFLFLCFFTPVCAVCRRVFVLPKGRSITGKYTYQQAVPSTHPCIQL